MSRISTYALAASLAMTLAVAGPANAGQHDLGTQEVEAYFQQMQQEATELVQAEDWPRVIAWIESNIAEGAVFQMNMTMTSGEETKGFASFTLDRDDMLRMSGVMAGIFQEHGVEQYSVDVEIAEVISHGPGAATARVRWRESLSTGGEAGFTMEQVADCSHLIQRDGERLVMGLSTCTGEARL